MKNNEIKYVKMIYTLDYDTKKDKSKRALLRAYEKSGIVELIENGCPFVLCYVHDGKMYDFVTHREIMANGQSYQVVDREEVGTIIDAMGFKKVKKLYGILCVMLFDEKYDLGFDITTMDEMVEDRRIQWNAYQAGLTEISPYDKETMNDYTIATVKKYNKR